jgi:ATP synthase protein I
LVQQINNKTPAAVKEYLDASALGVELVVSVLIGAGAGYWLDKRLNTFPWLTVIGLILGATAGFFSAYKAFIKSNDDNRD